VPRLSAPSDRCYTGVADDEDRGRPWKFPLALTAVCAGLNIALSVIHCFVPDSGSFCVPRPAVQPSLAPAFLSSILERPEYKVGLARPRMRASLARSRTDSIHWRRRSMHCRVDTTNSIGPDSPRNMTERRQYGAFFEFAGTKSAPVLFWLKAQCDARIANPRGRSGAFAPLNRGGRANHAWRSSIHLQG